MFNLLAHTDEGIEEGVFDHVMDAHHFSGDGGFTVFWMVIFMLFVAGIIAFLLSNSSRASDSRSPEEILKARYAKGEITKKQFQDMKKELK